MLRGAHDEAVHTERRYRASESAALREKLLVHWRQDVPRLPAALLEAAKDDPLVLDTGQEVSLVTTQKAQALLDRFWPQTPYCVATGALTHCSLRVSRASSANNG